MKNDLEGGENGGETIVAPPEVPTDISKLVEDPIRHDPPAPPARSGDAPPPEPPTPGESVAVGPRWWWWLALGLVVIGTAIIVADVVRNRETPS